MKLYGRARYIYGILALLICILTGADLPDIYSQTYFTGFAAAAANAGPDWKGIPHGGLATHFAGQLDCSDLFTLRTAFTFRAEDMFNEGLFNTSAADFRLDELSMTFKLYDKKLSHYISFFLGDFETPGSALFMQRQFGAVPAASAFLQKSVKNDEGALFGRPGVGAAYTLKFQQPAALRVSLYAGKLKEGLGGLNGKYTLNTDLRFSGVWRKWNIDSFIGFALPVETKDADGKDVFALIRTADMSTGVSIHIGDPFSHSVFLQAGLSDIRLVSIDSKPAVSLDNFNFIIEPRFVIKMVRLDLSIYNMDEEKANELFFIDEPLGAAVSVYSDLIYANRTQLSAGGHLVFSGQGMRLSNLMSFNPADLRFNITPFVSAQVLGGSLTAAFTFDCIHIKQFTENFRIMASYRRYI